MSDFAIGLLSLPLLLLLIFLRIPLAAAMFAVGLGGSYILTGNIQVINNQMKTFPFGVLTNYSFSIIPLFLLMSEFAVRGGMSRALFTTAQMWLGHRRGGVAMAAVGACAGFGAICGSSVATASAMGKIAYPELRRAGYTGTLSTGALAAGGTLGILIPPSIVLVVYALLAEENIQRLFTAAFIPGILALAGYLLTIAVYVRRVPGSEIAKPRAAYKERFRQMRSVLPVLLIFLLVMGGIYSGAFSPTAAAAVGAAGTGIVAAVGKNLSRQALYDSFLAVAKTSAMIFFIILSAGAYNSFLASATVPQTLAEYFSTAAVNPWFILIGMLLLYLVLGMVMDSLAMIFLTVPIFVPVIVGLDFGLPASEVGIWFGILVLMSAEVGLITPPVGLILFIINAMAKDVKLGDTYRGALPFVLSDIIRIALLVAFPAITLSAVRWLY